MNDTKIIAQAEKALTRAGINKLPISPVDVAQSLGVTVKLGLLPEDLSGFLMLEGDAAIIGVNSVHPKPRQRFTIAHELGHFLLHPSRNFVDRQVLYFRDSRSSQAVDVAEIEANKFAANLLMPERFVNKLVKGRPVDLQDDERVEELARAFGVSTQAVVFRLANLNLTRNR